MPLTSTNSSHLADSGTTGDRWLQSRLTEAERDGLLNQGFVSTRLLKSGVRAATLRFRDSSGRQRCKYIGTDVRLIEEVARAVDQRRRVKRCKRELDLEAQRIKRQLRALIKQFAVLVQEEGWTRHGWAFRLPTNCVTSSAQDASASSPSSQRMTIASVSSD